ncbi:MAG: tetratricopeptide repeat protein [Bryobacterales bacterium]|nr:tetratricopeptide repeat protein [Bryobacterales bacterium]
MVLLAQSGECLPVLERAKQTYEARRYAMAVAEFRLAVDKCHDPRVALLPLAQAQLMAQQLEESHDTLAKLLVLEPRSPDALKLQGDVLYLLGREAEAKAVLERALRVDPLHEGSQYALARIYYQQNRIEESRVLFLQLIERVPGNYRAHDNLALCYAALQQDSDAIRHFLKALDLVHQAHLEYDVVYANFANFLLERSEFEKAFQLAAEAAKRNPRSARNYFLTGKSLVKLDRLELSVRWLREATVLDPTYTEPRYWLAQVYRKLGKHDEAKRELELFRELSKAPKLTR